MHALSTVDSAQKNYSEGISSHSRNLADLSTHLANSENHSSGINTREAYDLQESARYFQNAAESWGKQYGLSARASMELLIGLGLDKGIVAKGTTGLGSNKEKALSSASNFVKSEEFQKHFQKIQDISSSASYGTWDETGKRLVESTSQSYERMQSSQQAFQIAKSELNQISENATWAEQNSHLIRRSLNQDFINWASSHYAEQGGFSKVHAILNKGDSVEQEALVRHCIEHLKNKPNIDVPRQYLDPQVAFDRPLSNELSIEKADAAMNHYRSASSSHFFPQLSKKAEFMQEFSRKKAKHDQQFNDVTSNISSSREEAQQHFQSESERSLYTRPFDLASDEIPKLAPLLAKLKISTRPKTIASGFQIKEAPFWMQAEEAR
jgi:conjugal transfer mating pair stabilization protein TraG